jgi:hypothetical protein
MASCVVGVNGYGVWAHVVELDDGFRMRFSIDDWEKLNLGEGMRIPIRLPRGGDSWLFITSVTEVLPVVWVVLGRRLRVAG